MVNGTRYFVKGTIFHTHTHTRCVHNKVLSLRSSACNLNTFAHFNATWMLSLQVIHLRVSRETVMVTRQPRRLQLSAAVTLLSTDVT